MQWAKSAADNLAGKKPLFVNMDETSISFHYGKQRGLVVSKHVLPPGKSHKKETVKNDDAKAHLSYLTFLTHDSTVQPKIPQIFLGNKHKLSAGMMKKLAPQIPDGFYVWREESSWNNFATMRKALCLLMNCLQDLLGTHQVILVLDVARCHFHSSIFALATRLRVRLLYVPAKLTWLLQPLDVYAFSRLKQRLRKRWLDMCVDSVSGEIERMDWLLAVFDVAKKLLCEVHWHCAFESVGLLDENKVNHRVLKEVGWIAPRPVTSSILSHDQVKAVFPRRSLVDRNAVFRWAMPKVMPKAKAKSLPKGKAKAKSVPAGPISSRLRKKGVKLD